MLEKIVGKKSENFWSKFFWDQNFSIFDRKIFRWKSQWKFKILKLRKCLNFFFGQKTKNFGPQKNSTKRFRIFFDEIFSDNFFSDNLFRSQMIPRFRKSHLEQRATIIKLRTASTKKKFGLFSQYCHKTPSIWIEFRGSSVELWKCCKLTDKALRPCEIRHRQSQAGCGAETSENWILIDLWDFWETR